jgi:hypothetical protein
MTELRPSTDSPPKARRIWPLFWLGLFVLSQVLVPAILLAGPRPVRFGWQMYAAMGEPPTITLLLREGGERLLPIESYIVRTRFDMQLSDEAVAALCAAYPEAARMRYTQMGMPAREVICPL